MDSIRVSKVENVSYTKAGTTSNGTVHLTAHHLIFQFKEDGQKEHWIPYPLISLVTRLPQTLQGHCPVTFHCRTFESFSLQFSRESEAIDVFDSVKELTVATSVSQLYAFFYTPNPPFASNDGWSLYSPREEFGRMGVGTRTKAWRFTDINKDYSFCATYPARLVVPTKISDTTLQYASKYRSKCRIPALAYLHWSNFGTITRSSQPMVGITQNRSIQDEKLIEAIFQSHHNPESRASSGPVYGATSTNLIIDARPTTNAVANTAKGAGTENMDHYKEGKKAYLGIDNIHQMRESIGKVVEALREADATLASVNNELSIQGSNLSFLDKQALRRSGWLRHLSTILEGTVLITRNVHINSSHVLIHCSDGWDRTAQLSSLSQLCLDPFYRTMKGFQILVEKDWLSFGHKFLDRCGHLSSEKFFITATDTQTPGGGADAAQAFLASVQNRFTSQHHLKETSPVFHQFLECVRQIQRQFPQRFEFNERFLHQMYYHLYSCQFGTFLFNCERERRVKDGNKPPPIEQTVSIWDSFNSPAERDQNLNPEYDASLDDPTSRLANADMGVLYPNPKDVRFWQELYGRTDEEMNGRLLSHSQIDVTVESETPSRSATPSITTLPETPDSVSIPSQDTEPLQTVPSTSSPTINRKESFRPLSSTTSAFSMQTAVGDSQSPASPSRTGPTRTQDFLNNPTVKSMWGRLSSNASAAFSVVQEAYEGVAKDIRIRTPNSTEELSSRDNLSTWGEESQPEEPIIPRSTEVRPLSTANPWASIRVPSSKPLPSLTEVDNPWGSVRTSRQTPPSSTSDIFKSLPDDPTVAHPPAPPPKPAIPSILPPPADDNSDPLGVGLS